MNFKNYDPKILSILILFVITLFAFTLTSYINTSNDDSSKDPIRQPGININYALTQTPTKAPSNLVATVINQNLVELTWTDTNNGPRTPTGFLVYRDNVEIANITTFTEAYNDTTVSLGNIYAYNVSSYNVDGEGPQSSPVTVSLVVPNHPENIATTPFNSTQIDLSWNPPANVADVPVNYYKIYRDDTFIGNISSLSYSDSEVVAGNTYAYKLSSVNGIGEGSFSAIASIIFDVPGAPTNIKGDALSGSLINVTWNAPTTALETTVDFYLVFRNETNIANTSLLYYEDSTVSTGNSYVYRIAGFNTVGLGTSSSETLLSMQAPTSPTSLNFNILNSTRLELLWNTPVGSVVSNYNIYRNSTLLNSVTGLLNSYIDTNVSEFYFFNYTVTAENLFGESGSSNTIFVNIIKPSTPSNFNAVLINGNQALLTWEAPSSGVVSEYLIYRNDVFLTSTSSLSYTDTTVSGGSTYSYKISANNSVGESPQTTSKSVAIPVPTTTTNPTTTTSGTNTSESGSSSSKSASTNPSKNTSSSGSTAPSGGSPGFTITEMMIMFFGLSTVILYKRRREI